MHKCKVSLNENLAEFQYCTRRNKHKKIY